MNKITRLFIRYISALLLGIFITIFYIIFTPLTVYPVYFVLKMFYPVVLSGITLTIYSAKILLVPACIAGSAYYLLLILNLLTPMKMRTRIKAIVFSFLMLLIINILRILLFSTLFIEGFKYFDLTHLFFWYVLSIIFVFLIWIMEIKIFKIKEIPIYTDLNYLLGLKNRGRRIKK